MEDIRKLVSKPKQTALSLNLKICNVLPVISVRDLHRLEINPLGDLHIRTYIDYDLLFRAVPYVNCCVLFDQMDLYTTMAHQLYREIFTTHSKRIVLFGLIAITLSTEVCGKSKYCS